MGRRRRPSEITLDIKAVETAEIPDRDFLLDHGRCADVDPNVFFPPITYEGERKYWNTAKARLYCSICPIRIPCLAFANSQAGIIHTRGVWGGRSRDERRTIANALRYRQRLRAGAAALALKP